MTLVEFLLTRIAEDERDIHRDYGDGEGEPGTWLRWMLDQCKAKREIIRIHGGGNYANWDGACDRPDPEGCPTLGLLADSYADQPDYKEAWK